jgi:hypothetical protein
MITMILFGLVFGHWWKSTLVAATLLWPALLLATGVIGFDAQVLGAALFGLANAGVGIGIHQGIAWTVRNLRARHRHVTAEPLS